jgi:hypothetical protein
VGHFVADAADRARGGKTSDLFARVVSDGLRPQAHDIIRTWLFPPCCASHLELDTLPWRTPPSPDS